MVDLGNHSGTWSDPGPGVACYSSASGVYSEPERELEFSLPELTPRNEAPRPPPVQRRYSEQPRPPPERYFEESHDNDSAIDLTFKILVLGDSSVGKTCLIWRFCEDTFFADGSTSTTVGLDFKQRIVELDGCRIKLLVWDTAGQERFRTLTTAYYRGAMGILLLYDVTSERTFNHITSWLENIAQNAPPGVCKILVGNKCDMETTRAVPTMRAVNMASAFDLPFYETSAKVAVNVEPAFMALVKKMLDRYRHRLTRLRSSDPVLQNSSIELQRKSKEKRKWCSC